MEFQGVEGLGVSLKHTPQRKRRVRIRHVDRHSEVGPEALATSLAEFATHRLYGCFLK